MTDVTLTGEQRMALEEARRWETEALARLGSAQLRYKDALRELKKSEAAMEAAEAEARRAASQQVNVTRAVSLALELPAGYWTYDASAGRLVKQETSDA